MLESTIRLRRLGRTCRLPPSSGPVAQLAEQQTLNLLVLGSTPSGLTTDYPNKIKRL